MKKAGFVLQLSSRQHGMTVVETRVIVPEIVDDFTTTENDTIACPRSVGVAIVLYRVVEVYSVSGGMENEGETKRDKERQRETKRDKERQRIKNSPAPNLRPPF